MCVCVCVCFVVVTVAVVMVLRYFGAYGIIFMMVCFLLSIFLSFLMGYLPVCDVGIVN
jgi:hypothetical protein